jgi:hypothetical protein
MGAASAAGRDPLARGLELLQGNEPAAAGTAWLAAAAELARLDSSPQARRRGALAAILATIAFERAGDTRAYEAWSQSVLWWLEAGTSWEEERAALRHRIGELEFRLRGDEMNLAAPVPSADEKQLLGLSAVTGLTDYQGPHPGLQPAPENAEEPIPVRRDYLARPLMVVEEEEKAEEENHQVEPRGRPLPEAPLADDARAAGNDAEPPPLWRGSPGPTAEPAAAAPGPPEDSAPPLIRGLPAEAPAAAAAPEQLTPPRETGVVARRPAGENLFSEVDLEVARTAWRYFTTHRQENTGMVSSVHGYAFTTPWELGSTLAGLVAAEQLGLLDTGRFHRDTALLLATLREMALYHDELPNREYQADNGRMVDLQHRPSGEGSGWSAVDIGRLLVWLRIVADWYPDLREAAGQVARRFDFTRLAAGREMHGATSGTGGEIVFQEGRLGYEQYAAAGYALWGVAVPAARDEAEIAFASLYGLPVPYDERGAGFLTSEPFVLAGLELGGIDAAFRGFTDTVYAVQRRRWEETRVLTAVSEDSLDQPPWFAYNTVVLDGAAWRCASDEGRDLPELRALSTKAAFGWAALYDDDYARRLRRAVEPLVHPRYGFHAGRYERGGVNGALSVNTNAVVLEAMLYLKRGGQPFLDPAEIPIPRIPIDPDASPSPLTGESSDRTP